MSYTVFVDHPESAAMREDNWTAWSFWSEQNAPWIGLGVQEMAGVLEQLADQPTGNDIPAVLNSGGHLTPDQALSLRLFLALNPNIPVRFAHVLTFAANYGHGLRVELSPQAPMTAVTYLANKGSARS